MTQKTIKSQITGGSRRTVKLFVNFRFSQKTAFFSTEVQDIISPSLSRVTTGQGHLGNPQIEQFKSKNMGFMAKITKLTISQLEPAFKGLYAKNDYIFTNINARTKLYTSKWSPGSALLIFWWIWKLRKNFYWGQFPILQSSTLKIIFFSNFLLIRFPILFWTNISDVRKVILR